MNVMNKFAANPFINASLLGDDAETLVSSDSLEGHLNQQKFRALKVVVSELRHFAGKDIRDERLLFVQPPPFQGWSKVSLYEALDKFLAKCSQDIDFNSLQVYLGACTLSLNMHAGGK